jgi:glycerol uptake facilitator-like aquaporin
MAWTGVDGPFVVDRREVAQVPIRALVAEFVGTALLLAAVAGSGIMGERLANPGSRAS